MSTVHADAPFLRRVLVVLVMATVLSGTISGVGGFQVVAGCGSGFGFDRRLCQMRS